MQELFSYARSCVAELVAERMYAENLMLKLFVVYAGIISCCPVEYGGKGCGEKGKGAEAKGGGKGCSGKESRVCYNCYKPGHLSKDCWARGGGKGKDKNVDEVSNWNTCEAGGVWMIAEVERKVRPLSEEEIL